jgi:hypothetical protein
MSEHVDDNFPVGLVLILVLVLVDEQIERI